MKEEIVYLKHIGKIVQVLEKRFILGNGKMGRIFVACVIA